MSKSTLKKVLFVALFAALLTCCLVIGIAAAPADDAAAVSDGYVARTGEAGTDTYYKTLTEAIAAVPENGTVTVIADTALDASVNLTKSVTLAGNGVISTSATGAHTIVLAGNVKLTVTGNVEIKATGDNASAIYQSASANTEITLSGNAKVTSNYWTINYNQNTGNTANVKVTISENASVSGKYGITINKKFLLNLTMTGGAITTTSSDAVYVDSASTDGTANINISGGTIAAKRYGIYLMKLSRLTMKMTGGSVSGTTGIYVQATVNQVEINLFGGSVSGTTDAAVWLNPVKNSTYSDCVVNIDGASLTGKQYAIAFQGYSGGNAIAYMTVNVKESDPAKPTLLSVTDTTLTESKGVFRMVDASQVELNVSGGTFTTAGKACVFYASNVDGYTKFNLSGGTAITNGSYFFWNNGRTFDVTLSGSFDTGDGQTGSFGTPTNNLFNLTGGTTNITSSASITAAKTFFYNKGGKQNIKITGGKLTATGFIFNNNGATANITVSGGALSSNGQVMYTDAGTVNVELTGSTATYTAGGNSVFCTSGGTVTFTVNADITATKVIFRAQAGTQNVIINGGNIACTTNIAYNTFTKKNATTTTNVTINGGDLTTNGKSNMFYAIAGTLNVNFYGGVIHDGKYLVHYYEITTAGSENFAKGQVLVDMSSGYISTGCSLFVSNGSSEGNVRIVKGTITCTTAANEMYILARWGAPNIATGGTAVSNITVEGGNFSFSNAGKTLYTAVIGMKGSGKANVTISGGTLDGGNYGIRVIDNGNTLNLTMTGGTLTARSATSGSTTQPGSVIYSESKNTTIKLSGGTVKNGDNSVVAGINIKKNVTADITINGSALINVTGNGIVSQNGDTGTSMKLTVSGGTIKATYNALALGGVTANVPDSDYTAIIQITGGTFETTGYVFALGNGSTKAKNIKMTFGGNARVTASNTKTGYFLVLNGNTLLDLDITGGTVTTARASIHLDSTVKPTAERPFPVIMKMSGGSITSGDVALNIKNTCLVDFTMTGGTLTNRNANTAVIRNDDVINAGTDLTHASRITIGEKATLAGKGIWIWAQNGAMDITLKGDRVYNAENGMIRISGGKSGYASTVTVEGGICVQPITDGGYVFYNGNKNASFSFPHGFTAYGGRSMIVNYGNGPATTLPGSAPDSIYAIGAPVVKPGASVRMVPGSNGLRFISHIDAATVTQILSVADAGTVSYGTLIFPASYLNGLSYYTHDTIQKYLDITAKNGLIEDGEGGYNIRAAIVNIKETNYDRDFVAIAYAKYETNDVTHYRYSAMQILQTSRNIRQLAAAALADTSATQTGAYVYPVNGVYSRYTDAQREVLNSYSPAALKDLDLFLITGQSNGSGYSRISPEFRTDHPKYVNGFSNVLYSGYACSGTGVANPYRWGTLIPVPTKAGFGRTADYIGAELGLAEMLSNVYNTETGRTAAILKYADGGTYLSDNVGGSSARQGNWTSPSYLAEHGASSGLLSGNLYRNFIILAEQTIAYYQAHGYNVNAGGMFWMQGEAERNYYNKIPALGNEADVASPTVEQVNALYTNLFKALVNDTRKDIGNILGSNISTMPVIAGSISEAFGTIQSENQTRFVEMQAKMVSETEHTYLLPYTRYLTTGTDSGDTAHYSADDMVFAGNHLGAMFLTLYGEEAAIPAPAESDYVAEVFVGGVSQGKYTNLGYAINTAPDNATVKLLRNVTLYGPLNIATFHKNVIVDGNGFTVNSYSNGHAMKVIGKSTNITLHNFRLINHREGVDNAYAIYMFAGATLNITGDNTYIEAYRYAIVVNQITTVNIAGGTFTTRDGRDINSAALYVGSNSTVNITGGNFVGVNDGAAVFAAANFTANITITGGTFSAGKTATYAIYSISAATILNVSGATITPGTSGSVYNKNTSAGTQTY